MMPGWLPHRFRLRLGLGSTVLLLTCGCARSPVFNVLGSYFPGWIACILLGTAFAAGTRMLLHRFAWEARIAALPLFYLGVALAVACAFWLVAFE